MEGSPGVVGAVLGAWRSPAREVVPQLQTGPAAIRLPCDQVCFSCVVEEDPGRAA